MNLAKSHSSVLLCVLAMSVLILAAGQASAASCNNVTLKGVFGALDSGWINGQPEATLTQITFDGAGNASGVVTNSKNGTISTGPFAGTYSVAKNCTGTTSLTFQGGLTANNFFVIDNAKKGAAIIRTDTGLVKAGISAAQGNAVCGLTGKKQTLALNLQGLGGSTPVAAVGQVVLDGKGRLSGKETLSVNGAITLGVTLTGTYTVNSNCTGTAQIMTSLGSTNSFAMVVVNVGKELLVVETDPGTTISGTMQQ